MATAKCKQCKKKHLSNDKGRFDMYQPPSQLGKFCDSDCMSDWVGGNADKIKSLKSRAYDAETKKLREEVLPNDTKKQHEATQKAFNKMRKLQELLWFKLRNKEPECISCGKTKMDWCCGHFSLGSGL